jgi:butyryl-CoA dehydrogenase/short/branched chain acyl-CoA dehydrogenase
LVIFSGIQFQLTQIQTEIEAARLLTYNAARLKETGQSFVMEAAICKLYAGQIGKKASAISLEFMGGVGFTRDFTLEKFYRNAMVGQSYESTSNIQLLTITLTKILVVKVMRVLQIFNY